MRLDDVAPRTLLLGAFAGWALAAWILALAGMGGQLVGPASGSLPAPALPPVPPAGEPALGPFAQYEAIAARPLFATDRRPHPFFLGGNDDFMVHIAVGDSSEVRQFVVDNLSTQPFVASTRTSLIFEYHRNAVAAPFS